jgi:hypothetical protein
MSSPCLNSCHRWNLKTAHTFESNNAESVEKAVRLNKEGIKVPIEGRQRQSAIASTESLSLLQTLLLDRQRTQGAEEVTPSSPSFPSKFTSSNLVGSFPQLEYKF